jgi:hypothetical protein
MWKSPLLEPLKADAGIGWADRLPSYHSPRVTPATLAAFLQFELTSWLTSTPIYCMIDVNLVQNNINHAEHICTNNMMAVIDGREDVSKTPLATRLTVTRPEERRFTCSKPVSRLTFASSKCIIMVFIWCSTASIM